MATRAQIVGPAQPLVLCLCRRGDRGNHLCRFCQNLLSQQLFCQIASPSSPAGSRIRFHIVDCVVDRANQLGGRGSHGHAAAAWRVRWRPRRADDCRGGSRHNLFGRRGFTPPNGPPPLVFLVVPIFDLIVFSSLVAAGLYYRNQPDTHKRLKLLSTLGILGPGVARLPIAWILQHGLLAIFGIQDLVLVACITYDTVVHRRLHRAFLWGGLWVILSLPLRMAVASTSAWASFAHWLIR
jgi:hypothetical protein